MAVLQQAERWFVEVVIGNDRLYRLRNKLVLYRTIFPLKSISITRIGLETVIMSIIQTIAMVSITIFHYFICENIFNLKLNCNTICTCDTYNNMSHRILLP